MPSKKRRRAASHDETTPAHSSAATSFKRFATLPAEIRHHIVQIACLSPSSSSNPSSRSSPSGGYDISMALALSLVCREIYNQVFSAVWHSITITRPSSLYALHQALLAKPNRAALIKSLHIGPQDTLPPQWFPLSEDVIKWISTSLDKEQLPSGLKAIQPIALEGPTFGCREGAVRDALNAARLSLDFCSYDVSRMEQPRFNVGPIYETQAALDLYLIKLKAMEDEDPNLRRLGRPDAKVPLRCRSGHCDHYPALAVASTSSSSQSGDPQSDPPSNVFTVSPSQLMRHLTRPGSATDRFDHPLIFSRSGIWTSMSVPTSTERAREGYRGANYQLACYESGSFNEEREDDLCPQLCRLRQEDEASTLAGVEALNVALLSTATIPANLRLARAVLTLASNLSSLSLTGFLERALDGFQTSTVLHRVSLGPPPCGWTANLCLSGLDHVEELRICGVALTFAETGALSDLTRLRLLEWSMAEELFNNRRLPRIWPNGTYIFFPAMTVERLLQAQVSYSATRQADSSPHSVLVVARLHPNDVQLVLAAAPSAEVQEAWQQGRRVAGGPQSRRLLLLEHGAAAMLDGEAQPSVDSTSGYWEVMYEEGRLWRREATDPNEGGRSTRDAT